MPKGDHILIPEMYNYVTSHGKGGFEDVNKLFLQMGRACEEAVRLDMKAEYKQLLETIMETPGGTIPGQHLDFSPGRPILDLQHLER